MNHRNVIQFLLLSVFLILLSCDSEKKKEDNSLPLPEEQQTISEQNIVAYAKGFTIEKQGDITLVTVTSPWANADQKFTYALIPRAKAAAITLARDAYDAIVLIPVERMVVTSTTHVPMLELLESTDALVGFPGTDYISSEKARELIVERKIKDIGQNEDINMELLLDLEPEVVVGFTISNTNAVYKKIEQLNIPVIYNGDWTERTPLGRAEWIKFFAPFFEKEAVADRIFNDIEKNYNEAKAIAAKATKKPSVLSGGIFKDVWYLPAGESFQAQFLTDANTDYLWKDSEGTGSLSLSIETMLDKAANADIWIAPGNYKSYEEMLKASENYALFAPFQDKNVFTTGNSTGKTGGTLYHELAPVRPDIVLKDIIKCAHPELLPKHEPVFFKPLL